MVLIQVTHKKDADRVFDILIHNGRFTGLKNDKFRIDENEDSTIRKIKKAGIKIKKF